MIKSKHEQMQVALAEAQGKRFILVRETPDSPEILMPVNDGIMTITIKDGTEIKLPLARITGEG